MILKLLNKINPFLPKRFRLPFYYYSIYLFGGLELELVFLSTILKEKTNGVAIDVGANQGLYSFCLSKLFKKVYAFEINPNITKDLQNYNSSSVEIIHTGLSDNANNDAVLYVPIHQSGLKLLGWASLMQGNCPDVHGYEEMKVKINTLDSFNLNSVSFIKVDIEGNEVHFLQGAKATIERSRPVILIEVKDKNREYVDRYFNMLDYKKSDLYHLLGINGSPENILYMPN